MSRLGGPAFTRRLQSETESECRGEGQAAGGSCGLFLRHALGSQRVGHSLATKQQLLRTTPQTVQHGLRCVLPTYPEPLKSPVLSTTEPHLYS